MSDSTIELVNALGDDIAELQRRQENIKASLKSQKPEPQLGQIWSWPKDNTGLRMLVRHWATDEFSSLNITNGDYFGKVKKLSSLEVIEHGEFICHSLKEFIESGRRL